MSPQLAELKPSGSKEVQEQSMWLPFFLQRDRRPLAAGSTEEEEATLDGDSTSPMDHLADGGEPMEEGAHPVQFLWHQYTVPASLLCHLGTGVTGHPCQPLPLAILPAHPAHLPAAAAAILVLIARLVWAVHCTG